MAATFLGAGASFPLLPDPERGGLATATDEEKVRQSIWIILTTAPGERVMRADFGCGIHRLVFESISDATIGRVASEVTAALARWEPRIDLLGVRVQPDAAEPNLLHISIDYQLRSTNSRFNLVYPFYVS